MRKYLKSGKIILWAGAIALVYMFVILASETSRNYQLRSKADELDSQISRLEGQVEDLGYKITYYKTDSFREKLAREKLNVAGAGESVVIIKDDKRDRAEDSSQSKIELKSDEQVLSEKPNYQQWSIFIFDK
ncbi:MAG: septum formation initiator family protein [Patescibacteria group bacterium]|nr:septum formation initiator family protein [Patescibacteria group bacterium]